MSPVNLGDRPSNIVLPVGIGSRLRGADYGGMGYPADAQYFFQGPGAVNGMQLGPYIRPNRFWLICGANGIFFSPGGWTRYDMQLRFVTNPPFAYANDLNGIGFVQKADAAESSGHANAWQGWNIEAHFYCEANTECYVQLLSKGGGSGGQYYQSSGHLNMWAYTVGEGVY